MKSNTSITSHSIEFVDLSACDRLEAAILLAEVGHPNGMMQNVVVPIVIRIGSPYDTDEGQILTVSPRDRIDDAESLRL